MKLGRGGKELLERDPLFKLSLQSSGGVPCKPTNNGVDLRLRSPLFFRFFHVERVDAREFHGVDAMSGHGKSIAKRTGSCVSAPYTCSEHTCTLYAVSPHMLYVKTEIRASSIHGIGHFAAEDISKGSLISQFEPGFDILLTRSQYEELPKTARDFFDHYGYWSDELDGYICLADNHRFTNHSYNPNIGTVDAGPGNDGKDIALRDIPIGEELTVDYRLFGEDPGL